MSNSPRYVGFLDPPYNVTLTDDGGNALDLTGCVSSSFTLTMLNINTGLAQQCIGTWTVANQTTNKGQASYQWMLNDMATAGLWQCYTTVKLPSEPSPREFDPEIIQILPGTVGAGAAPAGVLPAPIAKAIFFNGADYGVVGDGSDQTVAFNTMLATAHAAGGGIAYIDAPNVTISAPLRVHSNTTLMLSPKTTVTLAANSNCNMLQNYAVQANRRITDGVTNSTTTFTSATAVFVAGDVGAHVRIYYQDGTYLDTTIASVTNGTTAILAAAATHSQTGLYASIGAGRDSNIKVLGGLWVRPAPNGPNGYNGHNLRFRHCDTLEIGRLGGSTTDGKFLVSLGDCTVFQVHDVNPTATNSDTVHVNGPCSAGFIERISNLSPGDDVVAFTCGDDTAYADVMGNITDITCDGVRVPVVPPLSPFTVRILAGSSTTGSGYTIDRITVRDVRSMMNNNTVNVCNDLADPKTQGGTWGRIVLDGITNDNSASTLSAVNVAGAVVADLEARSVTNMAPTATAYLSVQSGVTITRLVTDTDRRFVSLSSGAQVRTYINQAQAAEPPSMQPAVAYYDGSSVSASVTSASPLNPTGGITIEMWLAPAGPTQVSDWTPIAKVGQYWIEGDAGGLRTISFTIVSGGLQYGSGQSGTLKAGQLNYIAATYDGAGNTKLYVNGVLAGSVSSIATTLDTSANPLLIGNRSGFSRFVQGQIADVRIWNAALSAADITAHNSDPGNLVTNTNAVLNARWKSDEGSGTVLNDSSGNGNNATLSSASWNPPATPYLVQPLLATGAAHTVDDVIAALQKIGLVRQS